MVTWLTPENLRAGNPPMWSAAEDIDDEVLQGMLDAAADACEVWLPAEDDPERPRDTTIRMAQLTLVRGLWNDAIADEAGSIGGDGFDYNPPWLAREARRMMRPPRGGSYAATGHDEATDTPPPAALPTWGPETVAGDIPFGVEGEAFATATRVGDAVTYTITGTLTTNYGGATFDFSEPFQAPYEYHIGQDDGPLEIGGYETGRVFVTAYDTVTDHLLNYTGHHYANPTSVEPNP